MASDLLPLTSSSWMQKIERSSAINCNIWNSKVEHDQPLSGAARAFVARSAAENSQRAYLSDMALFQAWGGRVPASPALVANYLAANSTTHKPATLTRWLASIAKAHRMLGVESPTSSELVQATLRGIRREVGSAQKQAKPLLRDDLFAVLRSMGARPKDVRDKALLLLGFAGGFRRSELVALDWEHLELVRQGLIVTVLRSKTDQLGQGRKIGVPYGRTKFCPVEALEAWKRAIPQTTGPLFRGIDRHGNIQASRLSGEAVSLMLKERVQSAGYQGSDFSGHSLRAGFATSAAQAGVSAWKIRAQTGHASDAMLSRYIRDGELWTQNAAGELL